ncbi:MAG: efflux transporter outer membrane subunit [Burkholderiaceae bacterium]|nr:efflux transporter outer membrane subunit [Burkholderiaceae bacterium]
MMRRLVSLAALGLGACTSLAPQYERPPLPVSERFPRAENADANAPSVSDLQWRDVFVDVRQRRLIELALQNNRDLRVAAFNVEQAQARAQIQRASLLPTVGAGISASRQPLPGGATQEVYSAGLLMTSYEIDFFGRLRNLSDAAQSQVVAAEQGRRTAQMSLVAAVAASHLALLADEELLRLTQQTLDTRIESMRLIKLRYDNGTASELDYQLAQSVVANARATLLQLQRQRELDFNALVLLVGAPLPADLPAGADTLASMTPFPAMPVGLSADVLQRRPDIAAAEAQLIAANFNIGAARAAFFPSVTLTASAGSVSGELNGLFKSGTWGWGAAPQLLQILFDSGRNAANARLAEATRDAAVAMYDRAIQSAFREVADALAGRDTLGGQTRALQEQTAAEAARLRVADLRYRNGVASSLDLLDAQRSLFAVQQQAVLAQLAQAQNQVLLYKALGGGWTDTTTTSSAR